MSAFVERNEVLPPGTMAIPLSCEACGERVLLAMPIGMKSMVAFLRAFEDAHCECILDKKEHQES